MSRSPSLAYRAEIDGLRAIAVIGVVLYHAQLDFLGFDWLPGGFVGVDIFFVISGYLISRIILAELNNTGTFAYLNFLERRARRILPMLFTIIIFSGGVAWVALDPHYLSAFSESALAAMSFSSNIYFYFKSIDYGADNSLLLPLLHTWSLSVEEQFYVFFPLLAVLVYKLRRKHLATTIIVVSFLSLLYCEVMVTKNSNMNFFVPFSRFWEFGLGALLAVRELASPKSKHGNLAGVLSALGMMMLLYAIIFFDSKTPFPSLYTLFPAVGTALVIGCTTPDQLVGRFLRKKYFVAIGLISYSFYLWHYPIMAFGRMYARHPGVLEKISWIGLSLFLSMISYHAIEQTIRNQSKISSKLLLSLLVPTFVTLCVCGIAVIHSGGFKQRFPQAVQIEQFDDRVKNDELFKKCHLLDETGIRNTEFCTWGNHSQNVYLVGDSHMISIAFNLSEKLHALGKNLVILTGAARIVGREEEFDSQRTNILKQLKSEIVIFGGYAHREDQVFFDEAKALYTDLFETLTANGNTILVVYPIPSTSIFRSGLALEYLVHGKFLEKKSRLRSFEMASSHAYSFYDSFTSENIYRVYPSEFLCDHIYCYGIKNEDVLISDFDHPASITAEWISGEILSKINGLNVKNSDKTVSH